MEKATVPYIVSNLGAESVAAVLGVSVHSVRKAVENRAFPASWYDVMDAICVDRGIECPRTLFNFKAPSASAEGSPCLPGQHGDASAALQPNAQETAE